MESKTKNKKTRQQIESMATRAFNGLGLALGEEAVTELKEGWFNVAYNIRLSDGREVILCIVSFMTLRNDQERARLELSVEQV